MTFLRLIVLFVLPLVITTKCLADPPAGTDPAVQPESAQDELEKKFEEQLSGAVLVGHFTISGKAAEQPLNEEKYTIRKVAKVEDKDDVWRFFVRIQYGKFDVTVPLDLQVVWAGDTPIITLENLTIPALGTFSARVLIHDRQYAGTWRHGEAGGHLFGRVTRIADEGQKPEGAGEAEEGASGKAKESPDSAAAN